MSYALWANASPYAVFLEISSLDEVISLADKGDDLTVAETIVDIGPSPESECIDRHEIQQLA